MNKFSRDKEYLVLSRKLQDVKRKYSTKRDKITSVYLEIAEYMKNSLFMVDEAKENYNKVINFGKDHPECAIDSSLAYRNLAEMAIEENDFDSSITKINKSLEYAYRSNNPGIIQQALHQRALIYLSCGLPDKALEYAEECKNYLAENATQIDQLKKDGDSKCRMAHLQNVTASIYMVMDGCKKKGIEINEKALKYASENNNWTLYYRCLLAKLNLTIGRERIQIAEMMCNIAGKIVSHNTDEKKFKLEAKCHLALEKLRCCEEGNIAYAKKFLWKCFEEIEKDQKSVSFDIFEQIRNGLIFVYKAKEREIKANSMNVRDNAKRRKAQMIVFEKIGDEASKLELNEIALHYYQRMLKCADSIENQKKALYSMAEAARDCCLFERAVQFYKQAQAKEVELEYNSDQLLETDIAIAILTAEIETISPKERLDEFEKVYAKCVQRKHKKSILPDFITFLKMHPNLCSQKEFEEKLEKKKKIESETIIGEDDSENNEDFDELPDEDEFDIMSEAQILFELKKEMKTLVSQEKIIKERTNKNKHGESNLHEVARSDDYQLLKQLIDKGYDINQLDNGGWTPLSEAVAAQKFANVRLLLLNGANPNTRSTEFLVDGDQNKITSSGLTPLMEACSFGNIDIIKILLQFKARVDSKDDDDWTALEYLWEWLLNANGLEREKREKLERIVDIIKKKQMEEGFNPRSYDDFLDLIELKKSSNRNKKKRNSGNSLSSKNRKSMEILEAMATSSTSNDRSAWIDDDSDLESEGDKEDQEESEDEEVRNLEDYQKCINGLRNRLSTENPKSSSIHLNRKRAAAGNYNKRSLSKKMFLVN